MGSSTDITISAVDSLHIFKASKSKIAAIKVIIPKNTSKMIVSLEKRLGKSLITKGNKAKDPNIPIKARVSIVPIFLVVFWMKKSPNAQKSMAPKANNK